jgi:hypothetical protein
MSSKETNRVANTLLDSLSREQIAVIAEHGYVGALPEGLSAEDREELLEALQSLAVCITSGAVRP